MILQYLLALLTALAGAPCDTPQLVQWPEADALFHSDRFWLGSDAAYSIPLDGSRTLWLFGDTFVAIDSSHDRRHSTMVDNTIAIQHGLDPTTASMSYYWGGKRGTPRAFFDLVGPNRYWPSHGSMMGDKLVLFLTVVGPSNKGLGFTNLGTDMVIVDNPLDDPNNWKIRKLKAPILKGKRLLVGAAVMKHGTYLYAYSCEEPSHDQYLIRWSEHEFPQRRPTPDIWCGKRGWRRFTTGADARPVMNAATEFSVHYDALCHQFVQAQMHGFGLAEMKFRTAAAPEGLWSEPVTVFRPAEYTREGIMIYAGKVHPELVGSRLIATYATNASRFEGLADTAIYYPRFARIK